MNKDLKSLLSSLGVILFYFYATAGIVKLLWDTDNNYRFEGRVKFLVLFSFIFSIIYVIGIYHIVGPYHTEAYYKLWVLGQLAYILVGGVSNALIKK